MAGDLTHELDAFGRFVSDHLNGANMSLEDSLKAFREYQSELGDLKRKLCEAEEQSARGESAPLDIVDTISKVREQLSSEGMHD